MPVHRIGRAACRAYLVACARTGEGILVDPVLDDAEEVHRVLDARGVKPRLVVDTHTHADHVSAGASLAAALGIPYALHESTASRLPSERLRDGQVLEAGDERVTVLHTPGHTGDSVSLLTGRELLTGDFLFLAQEGAGRVDLPGGDAGAHWDSLQRLASLGDDLRVLPGHDYHELEESTLGVERRRNPRFQAITREEYVAWQRAVAGPTPDWMLEVLAANLGTAADHAAHHGAAPAGIDLGLAAAAPACAAGGSAGACASASSGRVPLLAPAAALERLRAPNPPFLLDVREPWEFHRRRAAGATLVPLSALPDALDDLPGGPAGEVLVICKSGGRSAAAAEFLIESGRRRVFSVEGGVDRWAAEGLPLASG